MTDHPIGADVLAEVVERTVLLAAVPAPLGGEGERAQVVAGWWRQDGLSEVHVDAVGNVWGRLASGDGGTAVVCAHLDTVFGGDVDHVVRRTATQLHGPGVGDDTVAVASLAALRHVVKARGPRDVWIVATVGEEGLGNLRGARHVVETLPHADAFIAYEGHLLGEIGTRGLGSVRGRLTVQGPGGHSWFDAESPSAVHGLAVVLAALDAERPAGPSPWTWHAGLVCGGTAVNVLAAEASMQFEIRALDAELLVAREARLHAVTEASLPAGLTHVWSELGRRPAGAIDATHPLVAAAVAAHERRHCEWELREMATDANAAYAAGIPAITLGATRGGAAHTAGEWIEIAPIATGLMVLSDTLAGLSA